MKRLPIIALTIAIMLNIFGIMTTAETNCTITFDNETWLKTATLVVDEWTLIDNGTESVTVNAGEQSPLKITTPAIRTSETRRYFFMGYFSQPDGRGIRYYDADGIRTSSASINEDLTLFAHWEQVTRDYPILVIDYDVTGDSKYFYIVLKPDELLPARIIIPEREGYIFKGINGEPARGPLYNAQGERLYNDMLPGMYLEDEWLMGGSIWEIVMFDLIFDGDSSKNLQLVFGDEIPSKIDPPTRSGYIFEGYFDEPNGAGFRYYDRFGNAVSAVKVHHSTTLYAHWTEIPIITTTATTTTTTVTTVTTSETATSETETVTSTSENSTTTVSDTVTSVSDTTTTSFATSATETVTSTSENSTTTVSDTMTSVSDTSSDINKTQPTTKISETVTSQSSASETSTDTSDTSGTSESVSDEFARNVVFKPENGDSGFSVKVADGAPVGELPVLERAGYIFGGWYDLSVITGDIDGNGRVTIADALEILKYLAGMTSVIVNTDTHGTPTIADVLEILKHLAGMESTISEGVLITAETIINADITLTARWNALPPNVPAGFKAASNTPGTVTLTWNAAEFADGYEVYRSDSRLGTYAMIASVNSGDVTAVSDNGLVSGSRWFYTIRAYREVNGKRVYSEYSGIVEVVVK